MMLCDVCLSDVCRVHPVGGRRVRPAGCRPRIGPVSRLPLRASVAGPGGGIYRGGRPADYSLLICMHCAVLTLWYDRNQMASNFHNGEGCFPSVTE